MKYFWKILMDVYKFARGVIALIVLRGVIAFIVLMFIGTFIWSMYYMNKTIDETRHTPPLVAVTVPAPIAAPTPVAAPAAVPAAAPAAPNVAVDSRSAPVQEKSPVSIVVKHIGRGSNQFMPNSYISLVVMLKNDGKKAIKATKGTIVIYDAFGDDLVHLNIENAKTILSGKAVKEAGEWPIMLKTKAQNAISGTGAETSKLTFAFIPKVILFQDGSKFEQ